MSNAVVPLLGEDGHASDLGRRGHEVWHMSDTASVTPQEWPVGFQTLAGSILPSDRRRGVHLSNLQSLLGRMLGLGRMRGPFGQDG